MPRGQTHLHTARGRPQHAAHPGGAGQLQEAGLLQGLQLCLQLPQRVSGLQQPLLQVCLLLFGEGGAFCRPCRPRPTPACPLRPPSAPHSLIPPAPHQLGLSLLLFQLQSQLLDLVLQELPAARAPGGKGNLSSPHLWVGSQGEKEGLLFTVIRGLRAQSATGPGQVRP